MQATPSHGQNLPAVRRLEAVGFRAWPSRFVHYDGSWQIRLSADHISKRLNCVVPLDPSDTRDIPERLEKAAQRFHENGQVLTLRETPLFPPLLRVYLEEHGWRRFETVQVMSLDLETAVLPDTMDHLPTQDMARFADACVSLAASGSESQAVLMDILSRIKPTSGYFLIDDVEAGPRASALCIQDNDLAGLQSLAVARDARRKGLGRELTSAALRWARLRGAKTAWLQVSSANAAAIGLYEALGFRTVYSYHYWREQAA